MRRTGWIIALLAATACGSGVWEMPVFPDGGLLKGAAVLPDPSAKFLEALFRIEGSTSTFGDLVASRARDGGVSFFGSGNKAYSVLRPGCVDDAGTLVLEGYWRNATGGRTGLIRLFVEPPEAAVALCRGEEPVDPVGLRGAWGSGGDLPDQPLHLAWESPLKQPNPPFRVVAHRGGCRTMDQCGASENSLEVIRIAGSLGADAIEIDAQLTADGVPILYHDLSFSDRLVEGVYCLGPVSEFPLAHVRALCKLEYGEQVPTLDDALRVIVEETSLVAVWIDIKTPDAIAGCVAATNRWRARAEALGRQVRFVHGLYSDEMVDAWLRSDPPSDAVCLVELDPKDVRGAGCEVWAPRWTRGPMGSKVKRVQESGRTVAFWTLDEQEFIDIVLTDARPNAICTNRPGLVFQRFQMVGESPWGPNP
jgi:glycerophosphoryl diester phosphodiesterase